MKVNRKIVLTFDNIFPDEEAKTIDFYLEGLKKEFLIQFGTFILGFSRSSIYENPKEFLQMYFSGGNQDFAKRVWKNLLQFSENNPYKLGEYSFVYIMSSLNFFEHIYDKTYNDPLEYSLEEKEIRIFKAYLLFNEKNTTQRTETLNQSVNSLSDSEKATAYFIGFQLNNFEATNYELNKIFITQTLRAIHFFEFLSSIENAKDLLKHFYNFYDVVDYKEYIRGIIPIAFSIITKEREAHIELSLQDGPKKEWSNKFLNKFSIDDSKVLGDMDFRNTRASPLIKIKDYLYRIVYPLFAIELIGNGLYFKLKEINDQLVEGQKVNGLYGLKTFEFSEKYLLYKTLRDILGTKYVQRSGEELYGMVDGAPDYYLRNGKRIFLFESKDILINASVKQSSDFNEINEELKIKLYKNQKGSPKAVLQLINNIRKILLNTLEFDGGYNQNRVIIFPLLIVHTRVFNCAGVNKWVNYWFQKELEVLKNEGLEVSNVKPLVIIDIDTLLYNKDYFVDKKVDCIKCLEEYEKDFINFKTEGRRFKSQDEANEALKKSFLPFSSFLDNKIEKMGKRPVSSDFKEKGYNLFEDN